MRKRVVVAVVCALLIGVSAERVSAEKKIVIVGDSLSVSVAADLEAIEGVIVEARSARTIKRSVLSDNGFELLRRLYLRDTSLVVVQLGTNDAWSRVLSLSEIRLGIRAFAMRLERKLGDGACVAWVLPHLARPVVEDLRRRASQVSVAIREEIGVRPCWTIIDWPRWAEKDPAYLAVDGVHLSEKGKRAFVRLLRRHIKANV